MKTKSYTHEDFRADAFYKYPQWLFHDPELKTLSKAAKQLYVYFLNMNSLSFKNAEDYTDEQGEIYFICSRAEIRELMNCGYNQPRIYIDLLVRCGLVREKRMGCNRPNRIYLLKPVEPYKMPKKTPSKPLKQRIHGSRFFGYTVSDSSDTRSSCSLQLDKDLQESDLPSVSLEENGQDETEEKIKENIEYKDLCTERKLDVPFIDELIAVMLDVICTFNKSVRIGAEDKPRSLVTRQYMRLNRDDIERCIDQFAAVTSPVKNKPAYLRTMLYNAKLETDAHYINLVKSDNARRRDREND